MENLKKHTAADAPLEEKKLSLTEELSALQIKIEEAKRVQTTFLITLEDVKKVQIELNDFNVLIVDKKSELGKISNKILEAGMLERKLNIAINELNLQIEEKSSKIQIMDESILQKSKELDTLMKEKEKLDYVIFEKEKQQELLDSLYKDIAVRNKKMNEIDAKLFKITEELKNLEIKKMEFDKEFTERSLLLENREGDVSRRETWLANKEEKLKLLKNELEEYYNRKFPHIIL